MKISLISLLVLIISNSSLFASLDINSLDTTFAVDSMPYKQYFLEDGEWVLEDEGIYKGGFIPFEKDKIRKMELAIQFTVFPDIKEVSFYIGPLNHFIEVYCNGIKVLVRGNQDNKGMTAVTYNSSHIVLDKKLFTEGKKDNVLRIDVFPQYTNSPLGKIYFGSYRDISRKVFIRNFFNMYFIYGISMGAVILFLYFLFLFFFGGMRNTAYLYFTMTCLFFILGYINITFSFNTANQLIIDKISRIGFVGCVLFLSLFLIDFTEVLKKYVVIKIVLALLVLVFWILILVAPSLTGVKAVFDLASTLCITPLLLFCIVILLISIIKDKNTKSAIILIGIGAVIGASIHDMYYVSTSQIPFFWLVSYGYMMLVITIFFIISADQSRLFIQSLENTRELHNKNKSMQRMMHNIKKVTENLTQSGQELDSIVKKSSDVIERYGKENLEITNIILDKFEEIKLIVADSSEKMETSVTNTLQSIQNQSAIVEEITASMNQVNDHLHKTVDIVNDSNKSAGELAKKANESSGMVTESRDSITRLSEYTDFINEVLASIQDIAEKTNLLSLNAAIEAARAGSSGKGFSVIAGEVRKLSQLSKESVGSSFENLKKMVSGIERSLVLADQMSLQLTTIIDEAGHSALNVNLIREKIEEQERQSNTVLEAIQGLLEDTLKIKEVAESDRETNNELLDSLEELMKHLQEITGKLQRQMSTEQQLHIAINDLEEVLQKNLENIRILEESVIEDSEFEDEISELEEL